jgi:glutamate/aspartate transport system substrate-binding protein
VVTTAGTTNERFLKSYNADHKINMFVISAKDHGEAFKMLEPAAPAFYMDERCSANAPRPGTRTTGWWWARSNRGKSTAAWCARMTRSSRGGQRSAGAVAARGINGIYQRWRPADSAQGLEP